MAATSPSFHVAGVLVQARPDAVVSLSAQLACMHGAQVHAAEPTGTLVVTLESHDSDRILDALRQMQLMPGVLSAALVSEHSEALGPADMESPNEQPPAQPT